MIYFFSIHTLVCRNTSSFELIFVFPTSVQPFLCFYLSFPSVRLSVRPSIYLSIFLSIYLSIYLSIGARTFRPRTFRPRTFRPGHFGHGHFGHGHFGQWTFRPRTFRPWKKYILFASADGIKPFPTLQD